MKNKLLCNKLKSLFDSSLNSFENLVILKDIKSDEFNNIQSFLESNRIVVIYKKIEGYLK